MLVAVVHVYCWTPRVIAYKVGVKNGVIVSEYSKDVFPRGLGKRRYASLADVMSLRVEKKTAKKHRFVILSSLSQMISEQDPQY